AAWWLATAGRVNGYFRSVASVFTIHNLLYRGEGSGRHLADYGAPVLDAARALPDGFRDSPLALALLSADMLSTVSPTYSPGIRPPDAGEALAGTLRARQDRLVGILNGIAMDLWNPAGGEGIPSKFDADALENRAPNKAALQAQAGLPAEPRTPLLAVVSRLDPQKGLAIAVPAVRRWLARGGRFFLLGTGQPGRRPELAVIDG